MSEFETQSLEVARGALAASWTTVGIAIAALFASVVAGVVIYKQLTSQRWMSLLSFEQDMQARRREVIDLAHQLSGPASTPMLKQIYDAGLEGYLNSVDRLASSILNGQFPAKEMKQDYREAIARVIRDYPDKYLAGTSYRKTVKLHDMWQD